MSEPGFCNTHKTAPFGHGQGSTAPSKTPGAEPLAPVGRRTFSQLSAGLSALVKKHRGGAPSGFELVWGQLPPFRALSLLRGGLKA